MKKVKLDIQKFASDPPVSGVLIDEPALYRYHSNIETYYQPKITNSNKLDYSLIDNQPTIPSNVSDLNNDSGYITGINSGDVTTALGYTPYSSANPNGYTSNTGTITSVKMNGSTVSSSGEADLGTVITDISGKQDTLVSGTNIKTINNTSLLGSGNITIGGGGTATDVQINGTSITSSNVANILTNTAYNSSTNKIATMSDLPTVPTKTSDLTNDGDGHLKKYAITPYDGNGIQVEYYGNKWHILGLNNYANACEAAILDDVGDIDTLTTTDKSSIVAAINELVKLKPVVLWGDGAGDTPTNGNVTLTDSSANYSYIEIFFKNNNDAYNSVKVYSPNGKVVSLTADYCNNNVNPKLNYHSVRVVSISGSQISTLASSRYIEVCERSASAYIQMSNNNNIYITRVLGYK